MESNNVHRLIPVLIITSILLNSVSLCLFLIGFLPFRAFKVGQASLSDISSYEGLNSSSYKANIDKLVFIVIDAFRADFVPTIQKGFFNQTTMPYTENLIQSGRALSFISKCHSPTVTLPRIKSMLTGSIPSFADIIFNLDASSLKEDNFLSQAKRQTKRMVFYGDDTWLKLFPGHFLRYEGTTSFFVADYTEVDSNVTRHLSSELISTDWDILVLHYLGVDHIGHLAGPVSSLLRPKLQEMDSVIEEVHKTLLQRKRKSSLQDLIVITGDHGMSIGGNHGGVSPPEIMTPLIFISTGNENVFQHNKQKEVLQIDIAATLSVIYGLPIPKNNYGSVIKEVMDITKMTTEQQLLALYFNSMQLKNLIDTKNEINDPMMVEALDLQQSWTILKTKTADSEGLEALTNQIIEKYTTYLKTTGNILINAAAKYDISTLIVAIIISWQVTISLWGYITACNKANMHCEYDTVHFTVITVLVSLLCVFILSYISPDCFIFQSFWKSIFFSAMFIFSSIIFTKSLFILRNTSLVTAVLSSQTNIFLVFGTFLYIASLLSSSFIEEEHQSWYFLTSSYFFLYLYSSLEYSNKNELPQYSDQTDFKAVQKSFASNILPKSEFRKFIQINFLNGIALLVLSRILRSWNQTGNKWAHLPDIGDHLNLPNYKFLLTAVVIISIIFIVLLIASDGETFQSCCLSICIMCIYFYRVCSGQLVFFFNTDECDGKYLMQFLYVCLFVSIIIKLCVYYCKMLYILPNDCNYFIEKLKLLICCVQCWIVLSAALHRPHNIPLLAGIILQEKLVSKLLENKSIESITIVYSWMAMASFFYQGNSNSLSTIDVSAGYLGLSNYHPIFVGLLILCNTYSGIIFWLLMLLIRILQRYVSLKYDCSVDNLAIDIQKCICTLLCMRYLSSALYLIIMLIQRYHLFVWTVFTPKLLYEGTHNLIFSIYVIFMLGFSYQLKE